MSRDRLFRVLTLSGSGQTEALRSGTLDDSRRASRRLLKGVVVLAPASILLIEPDDDSRSMYVEYLRFQSFTCVTAITTDDALACSKLVDAVVTGIRVEGSFDGIELVRRLRFNAATRQLPIVVLSACVFEPDQQPPICDVS